MNHLLSKTTLVSASVLMLLLLAGCSEEPANGGGDWRSRSGDRTVPIVPHTVTYRADRIRIEAVGTARARRSADIFPDTGGEVIEVAFRAGDSVDRGEPLIRLDAREEQLAVERADVAVRNAQLLLDRYTQLEAPSAIARSQVDDARIALESAKIELALAKVALEERTVRAPFDGYVGLSDIDAGARITPQNAITRLDDRSVLFVDFPAPEQMFSGISAGDNVRLTPFSAPDQPLTAVVDRVDSRIDASSRAFTVRARVDNADDRLRPGMSFRIDFELAGQQYPAIPEAAIVWGGDGAYLWAVREGVATRVPLTIIGRQDGLVLVRAPLPEGSAVIAEGVQKVREGTAVTERYAGGGAPVGPNAPASR